MNSFSTDMSEMQYLLQTREYHASIMFMGCIVSFGCLKEVELLDSHCITVSFLLA
jgi:hypothetical protein